MPQRTPALSSICSRQRQTQRVQKGLQVRSRATRPRACALVSAGAGLATKAWSLRLSVLRSFAEVFDQCLFNMHNSWQIFNGAPSSFPRTDLASLFRFVFNVN